MSFTDLNIQQFSGRALGDVASFFGEDHKERVKEYERFWKWYKGNQWYEASNANDPFLVTLNYIQRCLDLKKDFFIKNGFTISIPDDPESSEDESVTRQKIKSKLDSCWKRNKKQLWLDKCVQMGQVTGDVFVRLSWDDSDKTLDPFVRADVLPSHLCFPVWSDSIPDKMDEFYFFKPIRVRAKTGPMSILSKIRGITMSDYEDGWIIERWTDSQYTRYVDEVEVDSFKHNLGVMPIVHIKNEINADSQYGRSDVEILISPQKTLNEKSTDISDIIDYHGSPNIVAAGVRADNLTKGPDKIWSIPQDAEIKLLEMKGDLLPNLKFGEEIYKRLLELASTPEQAINPTKNVSNTPGVALHMSYLPLIDVRKKKALMYGEGIKQLHRVMLRMYEKKDPSFYAHLSELSGDPYETELDWGDDLPRDKTQTLENDRSKLDMGITSRRRILIRDGFGEQDAERIIQEADEDRMKKLEIEAMFQSKGNADELFGKSRKPSPIIQGDRVSNNAIQNAGG